MPKIIKIKRNPKEIISGLLHQGKTESIFIICHGYGGSKDDFAIKGLSREFHKKGHSAFRFTFSDKQNFNLIREVEELSSIIDFFGPKYKKIVLVGGSMGALVASICTINKRRVNWLVVINGFFYLFYGVTWNFMKLLIATLLCYPFSKSVRKMINFYFASFKPAKIDIPTLVIFGHKDKILNPRFQSLKFFEKLGKNKKIVHLENIDHGLSKKEHVQKATESIINFIGI